MTSENTAGKERTQLGAVQQTLFITLAARARETQRKRPVLHDPKAAELIASIDFDAAKYERGSGGRLTVLRTAVYDFWVRQFLAEHPAGTVVELGTGLNTRFERVDNGQVHWIDLDLPTWPPKAMRRELPPGYRYLLLPLVHPVLGRMFTTLSLFTAVGSARSAQA